MVLIIQRLADMNRKGIMELLLKSEWHKGRDREMEKVGDGENGRWRCIRDGQHYEMGRKV